MKNVSIGLRTGRRTRKKKGGTSCCGANASVKWASLNACVHNMKPTWEVHQLPMHLRNIWIERPHPVVHDCPRVMKGSFIHACQELVRCAGSWSTCPQNSPEFSSSVKLRTKVLFLQYFQNSADFYGFTRKTRHQMCHSNNLKLHETWMLTCNICCWLPEKMSLSVFLFYSTKYKPVSGTYIICCCFKRLA